MDFYAGSQLRSFISFRSGETSNGQPTQFTEERLKTSQNDVDVADQASELTEDVIEVFEIIVSSPEPEETVERVPAASITIPKL